jgi:hypothetical protein
MSRSLVLASLFSVLVPFTCAAQAPQDSAASSAQTQTSAPTASPASALNPPRPKPKKVWTNENLADAGGTISVVGASRSPSKAPAKPAANGSIDPKLLANLRQELQKQQAQLAVVDQQLSELKDLSKGDSKHAGGLQQNTWSYNSSSLDEQIRNLQDKRNKIQANIDLLFDAARASGIEPGQLR